MTKESLNINKFILPNLRKGNAIGEEFYIKLPKIDFCESRISLKNEREDSRKVKPRLSDLCEDDREKIGHLVSEILRYKELYQKENEKLKRVFDENRSKNEKIIQLEQDLSAFKLGCRAKESDIKFLVDAHKIQENALKKQILEFQRTIMSMTKEKLNLEIELQNFRKQIKNLTKTNKWIAQEKKSLQIKYSQIKDKLKMALALVNYEKKPLMLNKKCEKCLKGSLNINNHDNLDVKPSILSIKEKEDQISNNHNNLKNDDALISELFFLPNQQIFPDLQMFS